MKTNQARYGQHPWLRGLACAAALLAAAAQADARPQEQTQGAVSYIAGGVGEDEVSAIRQVAADYPLEIELVAKGTPLGEHLTDAMIEITNADGRSVLLTRAQGPFLLARLAPGRYTLRVEGNGSTRRQTVDVVTGRHQRIVVQL